jgi:hypothetical protein
METVVTYRGHAIDEQQIAEIQTVAGQVWDRGRSAISVELCRQWDWRQPNGALKNIVCRGLLLKLERAGTIRLPASKRAAFYPGRKRPHPKPCGIDTRPVEGPLNDWLPIEWVQVRRSGTQEALFNSLIASYHYLDYCQTVGKHLKYLALSRGRLLACLSWGSAAWRVACRDRFIGWDGSARERNLYRVINNTRFLVLPFVRVPNLASYLLSHNLRLLLSDWKRIYAHRPVLLETFVQAPFVGICYRAANWIRLGVTQGRGKYDRYKRKAQPVKAVFVYPVHKQFRGFLCDG